MKIRNISVMVLIMLALSGCSFIKPEPVMTPLEIQSLQSREYDTKQEIVFRSVISVFQDMGYMISNADLQTGLIFAESSSISDFSSKYLIGITKIKQTRATAFIEEIKGKIRTRLNFVEINRTSSKFGQTDRYDISLLDVKLYDKMFDRIENAIFIRTSGLK